MIVPIRGEETRQKYQTIKEELAKLSFVLNVSASQNFPGRIFSGNGYKFEGMDVKEELIMSSKV